MTHRGTFMSSLWSYLHRFLGYHVEKQTNTRTNGGKKN